MGKHDSVEEGFAAAKVDASRHHLFLCLGPDCAPMKKGEKTWSHLKQRCAELKLPVMRTKAGCLKVCVGGSWLLVYPEGIWYGEVTPDRCERILQEHIRDGKPIAEWAVKTHPLCGNIQM